VSEETDVLARRAVERLAAAAERATLRDDTAAAVTLYERMVELASDDLRAFEWFVRLIRLRQHAGDLTGALQQADELIEAAQHDGDRAKELRAQVERGNVAHLAEAAAQPEERKLFEQALEVLTAAGDEPGLAATWLLAAQTELSALQWRAAALAADNALKHAELAGDLVLVEHARNMRLVPRVLGPFPAPEALEFLAANAESTTFQATFRATLEAMLGEFDTARASVAEARSRARELGQRLLAVGLSMQAADVELQAGDAARALELATEGVAQLEELGERGWLSTVAGYGAEAAYRLGCDDEAWRLTETAEKAGAADDVVTQMLIRQVRAKLLARRGELGSAELSAREAVALGDPTDSLAEKASSYYDLAIVLIVADKRDEALGALDAARRLYQEKGHAVGMARVDELRSELVASLEA
jgi:tetratricopeptide (TPR) repeat protein